MYKRENLCFVGNGCRLMQSQPYILSESKKFLQARKLFMSRPRKRELLGKRGGQLQDYCVEVQVGSISSGSRQGLIYRNVFSELPSCVHFHRAKRIGA